MITIIALLALELCAKADIVGGEEVQATDPIQSSTVGLYTPSLDGHGGSLCTASIIDKDIAVTAGHCVQSHGPKPFVLFGRDLHSAQAIKREAVATRVNPSWLRKRGQGMDQGDIALVRFRGGLPAGYHKISPAKTDAGISKGAPAVLAGYGISNARDRTGSGVLRKTQVSISDPRKGKSEMILDQSHGHGACHGDSGGPAFVQYRGRPVLAGVTNRSYPSTAPDDCGHQVVYTKLNAYRAWIKKSEKALRTDHAQRGIALLHRHGTLMKKRRHRAA